MGDEKFYKQVEDELNGKPRKFTDRALMTKAEVLAEGDKEKARYRYIQLRVEFLKNKEEEENKILALKEEQENKALALKKEEERNIKNTKEKKTKGFICWIKIYLSNVFNEFPIILFIVKIILFYSLFENK